MTEELPEIEAFTSSVARLHKSAMSPNSKFGFPITTYMGPLPKTTGGAILGRMYFSQGMRRMLELERDAQGPSEELDELAAKLYNKVIPRLLRPLAVLGSIEPVAIHGNLWYGTAALIWRLASQLSLMLASSMRTRNVGTKTSSPVASDVLANLWQTRLALKDS